MASLLLSFPLCLFICFPLAPPILYACLLLVCLRRDQWFYLAVVMVGKHGHAFCNSSGSTPMPRLVLTIRKYMHFLVSMIVCDLELQPSTQNKFFAAHCHINKACLSVGRCCTSTQILRYLEPIIDQTPPPKLFQG